MGLFISGVWLFSHADMESGSHTSYKSVFFMYLISSQEWIHAGLTDRIDEGARLPSRQAYGDHALNPSVIEDQSLAFLARTLIGRFFIHISSASELAVMLSVDQQRLSVAFLSQFDIEIEKCIVEERLKATRRLLAQTSMPLPEISRRVGFSHPSILVRLFLEFSGINPWAFRELSHAKQIAAIV